MINTTITTTTTLLQNIAPKIIKNKLYQHKNNYYCVENNKFKKQEKQLERYESTDKLKIPIFVSAKNENLLNNLESYYIHVKGRACPFLTIKHKNNLQNQHFKYTELTWKKIINQDRTTPGVTCNKTTSHIHDPFCTIIFDSNGRR